MILWAEHATWNSYGAKILIIFPMNFQMGR